MKDILTISGFIIVCTLIFAMIASTAGCSAIQTVKDNKHAIARVAVEKGVERVIDGDRERQERIISITEDVREYIGSEPEARAADIMGLVRTEIRWGSLSENETVLVEALLSVIQHELAQRIDEGVLDPDDELRVIRLVDWIEQAAYSADVE